MILHLKLFFIFHENMAVAVEPWTRVKTAILLTSLLFSVCVQMHYEGLFRSLIQ